MTIKKIWLFLLWNIGLSNLLYGYNSTNQQFKLGLENLSSSLLQKLSNTSSPCKIGLITNQTGKDQRGVRNIEFLMQRGITPKKIFVPEHGIDGMLPAGQENSTDKITNIPVISLYSKGTGKNMDATMLKDIDILIFDIQDSGMRHYTYISTLFHSLEAASHYNKPIIVLDRPNPLGRVMEGPLVEPGLQSFISIAPVPIRHGMTVGELSRYFNTYILKKQAKLHIVPMKQYDRRSGLQGKLPVALSSGIPNIQSCYNYSFLGLLGEIKPFDVALGTQQKFQCISLPEHINFPKQKWHELHVILKNFGIESTFNRYFSKRRKQYCSGLKLHISDINQVPAFTTFLTIVKFFKKSGVKLTYSQCFNQAIGTLKVRKFLDGIMTRQELMHSINKELHAFFEKAKSSFLYLPLPHVVEL